MRATRNPFGLMATPAPADVAAEHAAALSTLDFDKVITALPEVVPQAMKAALPEKYTPELAEQMAQAIASELTQTRQSRPVTAAERGTEWMLRWGCTPDCVNDHAAPNASEWHTAGRIETAVRDIDASNTASDNAQRPWLAAQVVVTNDKPQAYGRETRVWLDYGLTTGELSPAQARQALEAMREFVAQFEAVVAHAEQSAVDDFEGDPEIARLDREAERRRIRAITEGRA
ncbi:hypothetical protein [Streptomyces sp. ID05-47C]|uniref:hypothetical protein n=1 Tax=Streptomyces sp. ID05-47C TaxID=3028665 RepID=UPI0029B97D18|nr:hypothetical protein [Streptomyces sp. ID05-47C]MDX3571949.1 hypothetical protein [Streptomyces sp. ID05-47C]